VSCQLQLDRPNNHHLFFAELPCLIRLLPSIVPVHYVNLVFLSEHVLEEVMQPLDVPSFAVWCHACHRHQPLSGPAWLILVVQEAEWAKPVVLYQPLSLPGRESSEYFSEPGGVCCRAPHHVFEHTCLATIPLARLFSIGSCYVHSCCTCLG
jgi:hypothetical protein